MSDKEEIKCCMNCDNCVAIGEGDHICIAGKTPILILEEYVPTDNYWYCNGADYEGDEEEDYERLEQRSFDDYDLDE